MPSTGSNDIDLIVPVYINQRIVFDLVATLRDGISTVTRITESENEQQRTESNRGGSFGLGAALTNFIKLDFQGGRKAEDNSAQGKQRSEDRYHTPTSLFARLLSELKETGLIAKYEDESSLVAGRLIEIEANLKISPILKACENLVSAYETALVFTPKQSTSSGKKDHKNSIQKPKSEDMAEYGMRVIKGIAHSMRSGNGLDLVTSKLDGDVTAVITIEQQYLNDPKMADLMDGRFRIAGKVSRVVTQGEKPIDLLRNSQFGVLNRQTMNQMLLGFQAMEQHVQLPEPQSEIDGPAFQMIPIAIYA